MKTHIKSLSLNELTNYALANHQPAFRAKQLHEWIWKKQALAFAEMTNMPQDFRQSLETDYMITSLQITDEKVSADGTRKYALALPDDCMIESVLIPSQTRITACISTQVGCALGCRFCATGNMSIVRDLHFTEIHDQIILMMKLASEKMGATLHNIVVMGMGEPLLNLDNTLAALNKISDKALLNFSPQRITISTAGIVPAIKKMADKNVPYHLAISLHSAIEQKRKQLMPIANKYPLLMLIDALKHYYAKTANRITIEYILFEGLNDAPEDAAALANFCRNFPVKVNVIHYNPTANQGFKNSNQINTKKFVEFLESKNLVVNLRKSKGDDIQAACGQLVKNKKQ
ncbi:MAG: 23S rRNA (adenine(2503)-C(2))-methyltransferase RlmN [Bacteroidota bacterium]